MAPSSSVPYNPADHAASNALLPEEVFGHIDVATLTNIHLYLRESELQDDIELATWVQENYLYGVEKGQATAIIRTAQGFAQLDRAFRRVRSLTNKAQDKWPFFDKNFKQMSSATVRNNARGEAAPGVMYPIDTSQRTSSAAKHSLTSSVPNVPPTPQLQVPSSSTVSSRSQSHKHEYPRPARRTPVPLPSNLLAASTQQDDGKKSSKSPEGSAQEPQMCADAISQPDGHMTRSEHPSRAALLNDSARGTEIEAARDDSDAAESKAPDLNESQGLTSNSDDPEIEPQRDTGGGKVRGPNGRYLPKEDVLSDPKKVRKPTGKGVKSSVKTTDQGDTVAAEAAPGKTLSGSAEDENISVVISTPSTPRLGQETERQNADDAIVVLPVSDTELPLATEHRAKDQTSPLTEPTPAYLLAAEADAVPSNLDRLPPNSRKALKRKSEPILQSGERKRGKYGGIVGRPRKSEKRESNKDVEMKNHPQNNAGSVDSPPQMTTRRSTRRSAAASLETPKPTEPAAKIQKKDLDLPQKQASSAKSLGNGQSGANKHEVMDSTEAHAYASSKLESRPPTVTPVSPTKTPDCDLLGFALGKTNSTVSRAQLGSYQSPYQPIKQSLPTTPQNARPDVHMANEVEQGHPPGHVELLARLTTGKGVLEIPISADQINSDEAKIIKKYAEWNAKPDAVHLPYSQFRQLFSFVKKD